MPIFPDLQGKESTMNKIVMAEIQKDLSSEQRAPARALQCFPNLYSVRHVPPHRCNCDEVSPVPPTFLASSRALPGERVSPFQTEIWSRPGAPLHGLTLTTMSLHTMSVICSEIEDRFDHCDDRVLLVCRGRHRCRGCLSDSALHTEFRV